MQNHKALSLVETLLLIIVVLLVILIALTLAGTCNTNDYTTVCASNLRGIAQAMYIYAQDDPGSFPTIAGNSMNGEMRIFDPQDRVTMPPGGSGVPSPTVDLWMILRQANVTPEQFICPWTQDEPDPAQWPPDYYDFLAPQHLSYAYQYQHDPDRRVIGTPSEPNFPLMADANPYIKGGVTADIYDDRVSDAGGNSGNHRLRARGQNVLFQDSHVEETSTPGVGLRGQTIPELGNFGGDNVYTVWDNVPPIYVDPGTDAPTSTQCNLGGRSDACLVP